MNDHNLIMAMGKNGLGVTWSKNKFWTQVSKAKSVCNSGKWNQKPENQKKSQMQIERAKNQGVTNLPPLG